MPSPPFGSDARPPPGRGERELVKSFSIAPKSPPAPPSPSRSPPSAWPIRPPAQSVKAKPPITAKDAAPPIRLRLTENRLGQRRLYAFTPSSVVELQLSPRDHRREPGAWVVHI